MPVMSPALLVTGWNVNDASDTSDGAPFGSVTLTRTVEIAASERCGTVYEYDISDAGTPVATVCAHVAPSSVDTMMSTSSMTLYIHPMVTRLPSRQTSLALFCVVT